MDDEDLHDRVGSVKELHDGSDLVLTWLDDGEDEGTEMLRFNQVSNMLRIFPKIRRNGVFEEQFDQLVEIRIDAVFLPDWDPNSHSRESDRYGLLHVVGLPQGFSPTYGFGLGVKREYQGLLNEVEDSSPCTVVCFGTSDSEGLAGVSPLDRCGVYDGSRASAEWGARTQERSAATLTSTPSPQIKAERRKQ